MNRKRTKLVVIILIIFVGLVTINLGKSKVKNNTLIKETNNKSFAYFVQSDDLSNYTERKSGEIPTGYKINYNMTKCYDYNNKEVTANLTISMNKNKLSVLSSKTVYCKVYLDKQKGTGTQNDPYQIEYIEDLVELSNEVNSGTDYSGMYFALTKNLDFNTNDSYRSYNSLAYGDINNNGKIEAIKTELTTGDGFIPIGIGSYQFMGSINGNNHILSNLFINDNTDRYVGFVGIMTNGKIDNLTITGIVKAASSADVGGLIGISRNVTLDNCTSNIEVTSLGNEHTIGGLIGATYTNTTITNSKNLNKVSEGAYIGGIVGWNGGILTIEDSYNSGVITNDKGFDAGGLLGMGTNSAVTNIKNSYNTDGVSAGSNAGGLAGVLNGSGYFYNSYNIGDVTSYHVGGIIGRVNSSKLIIDGCYNLGDIGN